MSFWILSTEINQGRKTLRNALRICSGDGDEKEGRKRRDGNIKEGREIRGGNERRERRGMSKEKIKKIRE